MDVRKLAVVLSALAVAAMGQGLTRNVNVFIGTGGHGHTYPGATVPFGMVQLSPDTYNVGWDWCSGYHTSDSSIMGFSHTHLSGTGVGDMLDVLVMPGTGEVKLAPGTRENPAAGYRSRFSHEDETASPGYYSVLLKDYTVRAEMTATERVGVHRYTFPASESSHFMVDLAHAILGKEGASPRVISAEMKVAGPDLIVGGRRVGNWAQRRHIYFAMKFSKPFLAATLYANDQEAGATEVAGKILKCVVKYKTSEGEKILVKVGLSGVSAEAALKNLETEVPGWDFDGVKKAAEAAWEKELGRVRIETEDAEKRQIFYTAMYHMMLAPTLYDDVDGSYRGMDLQVRKAKPGQHNYSTYSLWDTYRALHPMYTLMQKERVPVLLNGLARMAEESPAGAPVWPLQGRETGCMTGYHSVVVLAEAAAKGFEVDYAMAYPILKKRAMDDDYRGLGDYRKLGYIPSDKEEESATKTLEYAYDDWAMARLAEALGKKEDAAFFRKRSLNYRNLWDASTGFVRPKLADGTFAGPFDPKTVGVSKKWRDFTEANSWQATWQAQHDPAGYIQLLGGREKFISKLDSLFTQSQEMKGEAVADMTGLIGMYAHGNEPSHHVAYLYSYAGVPYKTQQRVREILETQYAAAPDGLSGNEDCGQMSAWYVISALGFYAVDPVSANYVFGTPLFRKATIDVGGEKPLIVEAKRKSDKDIYIQSVTLNGKPYTRSWFRHADVAQGGTFVLTMGPEPNRKFGAAAADVPPSMAK